MNCKLFWRDLYCPHGTSCQKQHEHRGLAYFNRFRYFTHLTVYENLFTNSMDQSSFIMKHETGVRRLPVFRKIHSEDDMKVSEKLKIGSQSQSESTDCAESNSESNSDDEIMISQNHFDFLNET